MLYVTSALHIPSPCATTSLRRLLRWVILTGVGEWCDEVSEHVEAPRS